MSLYSSPILATPGPDSTLLVINKSSEESINIAQAYIESRFIPTDLQCEIEIEPISDINHAMFYEKVVRPVLACVDRYPERIEAIILTRGTPLRVLIDTVQTEVMAPTLTISSASLLTVAQSRYAGQSLASPENATEYAELISCTNDMPCWSPKIFNPWRFGHFSPNWFDINQGIQWAPLWVSRLDADSEDNTITLIQRGLDSDRHYMDDLDPVESITVLMDGADSARGALDFEYEALAQALRELGDEVLQVAFSREYVFDQPLSALITGSAQIGRLIEDNRYIPGAIIDNLTSFAAHPHNFDLTQTEVQASISRWIASGVSGAHGTTDEPLNISFPSRAFLLDYRKGATLIESFSRHLPFLAWQNVIIGDPMIAPYMLRPRLNVEEEETGKVRFHVEMEPNQKLITLTLWDNETLIGQFYGEENLVFCSSQAQQVLAVAQVGPSERELITEVSPDVFGDGFAAHYAKGWQSFSLSACQANHTTEIDMLINDLSVLTDLSTQQNLDQGLDLDNDQVIDEIADLQPSAESLMTQSSETNPKHTRQGCEMNKSLHMFHLFILIAVLRPRKLLDHSFKS